MAELRAISFAVKMCGIQLKFKFHCCGCLQAAEAWKLQCALKFYFRPQLLASVISQGDLKKANTKVYKWINACTCAMLTAQDPKVQLHFQFLADTAVVVNTLLIVPN